jgi:hypothetical protein
MKKILQYMYRVDNNYSLVSLHYIFSLTPLLCDIHIERHNITNVLFTERQRERKRRGDNLLLMKD